MSNSTLNVPVPTSYNMTEEWPFALTFVTFEDLGFIRKDYSKPSRQVSIPKDMIEKRDGKYFTTERGFKHFFDHSKI